MVESRLGRDEVEIGKELEFHDLCFNEQVFNIFIGRPISFHGRILNEGKCCFKPRGKQRPR